MAAEQNSWYNVITRRLAPSAALLGCIKEKTHGMYRWKTFGLAAYFLFSLPSG
jgi:hypothetical protein